jgi:hypothetical protein
MAAFVLDPLAASPFTLLDARSSLHLVTDVVHEDDVLRLALARAARSAWRCGRASRPGRGYSATSTRVGVSGCALEVAMVAMVARLIWVRGLAVAHDKMSATFSEEGARAYGAPQLSDYDTCRLVAWHGALATLQWAYTDPSLTANYQDKNFRV